MPIGVAFGGAVDDTVYDFAEVTVILLLLLLVDLRCFGRRSCLEWKEEGDVVPTHNSAPGKVELVDKICC